MSKDLRKIFSHHGQGHVFDHWEELSPSEQSALLQQLESIDVTKLADYLKAAKRELDSSSHDGNCEIRPFSGKIGSASKCADARAIGMEAIRKNSVASVLLAGGQGTRLGFDGPKGMYDIGLPSKKTLFCLIAERLHKLIQLASNSGKGENPIRIPLYIMTSPMNHDVTKEYFVSNDFFGLPADDVIFFSQGVLPCLDSEGKILLESPFQCAMAPDGNGGIYPAMDKCGVLTDMGKRNIEHIHVVAIDNAIVKPADPYFIGYCISQSADCGNKVLWKNNPHEKVGVIAEKDNKPCVVEYSELSKAMAEKTIDGDGSRLAFGAANIANHYYHLEFLKQTVLPNFGNVFHIAHKKIGVWDEQSKQTVAPSSNNGIKLESFIFDVFPLSTRMAIFEVERDQEFAPVKNAPGELIDSPDTARVYISNMSKRWLRSVGAKLIDKEQNATCEIVPLTSYAGEGLEGYHDKEITTPDRKSVV